MFLIKFQPLLKKETQTPVFFCELWDIFKNTFFRKHPVTTSPVITKKSAIYKRLFKKPENCKSEILNGEF